MWVLYNLIEIFEPKRVWGIPKVIDGHAILEDDYLIIEKFYRDGTAGQKGPDQCIEAVISNIKIENKKGEVTYIGYQRLIDKGVRPDFVIYTGVKDIAVEGKEGGEISIYSIWH